ncbi:MAG: branched-chain amino acid ABC transporter permease [Acidimicrobiia bacterium]
MEKFLSLTFNGLANGAVLALGALGFVLIFKATEVVNFAQGQLLLIGAFMVYTAHVEWGLPWPVAILVAMIFGALLGLVVERLVLRPLVGEASLSVIMVTIGLASALFAIGLLVWKTNPRPQPDFMPTGKFEVFGANFTHDRVLAIVVAAVVLTAVGLFYRYSKQGIAMRAVADDQQAAMVQGISVNRIFALSWALAGVSAVIAGLLLASINGQYNLLDIQAFGIFVFPVVILGGLDSLLGTAVGGVVVGVLYSYTGGYVPKGADYQEIVPFVVLVLILLIKPYGLFGEVRIERV